jgi:hypothetical protein
VLLLRRLRLASPLSACTCRCRRLLDRQGDHRAACPTAGVLQRRGFPLEIAAGRVCREAGARVRQNVFLRDLNVGPSRPTDGRRLEVVANGLPLYHGAQFAVDATLVCALKRSGEPRPGAAGGDGVALLAARRRKERTYPELLGPHTRARLVVLGLEVGGRWSSVAWEFVRLLARSKARGEPERLRRGAEQAWRRRWVGLLACAAARAFAASLLELAEECGPDGDAPSTEVVLEDARYCLAR